MKKLMMPEDTLFPWLSHPVYLYEYGLEIGLSPSDLLSTANLTEGDIADPALTISWEQFRCLAQCIEEKTDGNWGFGLGQRLGIGGHGLMSLAILNGSTWTHISRVISKYSRLINPSIYFEIRQNQDYVYFLAHPEIINDSVYNSLVLSLFTAMYQMTYYIGQMESNENNGLISIYLNKESALPGHIKNHFQSQIFSNHYANIIKFNKQIPSMNLRTPNEITTNSLHRILTHQLAQTPIKTGLIHELRNLFKNEIYQLDQCSKKLLCSSATLKRKLNILGTNYTNELQRYRSEEACWLLENTEQDISSISDKLGFNDVSSFRRFFKSTHKMSPSQFRNMNQFISIY